MRLTDTDHAKVTEAVTAAERDTAGEIVTIVARRSDDYADVAANWAVLAMLLALALLAAFPGAIETAHARIADPWARSAPTSLVLTIALVAAAATFLLARALFAWRPLLLAITPGAIKTRRAHARALSLFRAGAEKRTTGATGVLLYLSLDEHRAEIIADAAIHGKVAPETWGEAMAALLEAVKDGRPGDGMAAAVGRIGAILAEHFPRDAADANELPDRLIEL